MTPEQQIAALARLVHDHTHRIAALEKEAARRALATPHTLQIVQDATARAEQVFGVTAREIQGRGRTATLAQARQWVMFEARLAGLSYPQIGAALGRDHTTIKSGCLEEKLRRDGERKTRSTGVNRVTYNENSTKMKAGRNAVDAAPDPETNRNLNERC